MVTCKTPGEGKRHSRGQREQPLRRRHHGRSRRSSKSGTRSTRESSRTNGRLVEEVYRIGGLYDAELRRVVGHLTTPCRLLRRHSASALEALIRWYRTGEDADREAFDIAWVSNRDTVVDTMNGFIEVYMDARGMKGAWEGVVYYVNHEKTAKDSASGRPRPMVRGSATGRRPISQTDGARSLGPRHRGRVRDRRLWPSDAHRREPAERPAHPRRVRQQERVAHERDRRLRPVDAGELPPGVLMGRRRARTRERSGAPLPAS